MNFPHVIIHFQRFNCLFFRFLHWVLILKFFFSNSYPIAEKSVSSTNPKVLTSFCCFVFKYFQKRWVEKNYMSRCSTRDKIRVSVQSERGWNRWLRSHFAVHLYKAEYSDLKIPQKVQFEDVIPTLLKVFECETAKT